MEGAVKGPVIVSRRRANYTPTYRAQGYQRPFLQRLTPLTWFIMVVLALGVAGGIAALIIRAANTKVETAPFPAILATRAAAQGAPAVAPATPAVDRKAAPGRTTPLPPQAVLIFQPTRTPIPTPAPTLPPSPTPAPTKVPNGSPWADHQQLQEDGTWLAPQEVISQAVADLGEYYTTLRDLSLAAYLTRSETILATYFTGAALDDMRRLEISRTVYAMNRAGQFSIEVRDFAVDGWTAKAAVITRGWVNDEYNKRTKQLIMKGKGEPDTITVRSVMYDRESGRWKFASVGESVEVNP
jgi:hypothetical protein